MVSFSCEACGDILTKKKLDPHRGQCRGAQFTCLDCQTTFIGFEYRAHTSCISEAQKYQGKLYKEPKKKGAAAQNNNKPAPTSQALVSTKSAMEVPIAEPDNRVALVDAPPRAPSPPPGFNVFDFMISNGETPANSTHPLESPPSSPSSSEVSSDSESNEESDSDSMDTDDDDPVVDAAEAAREYMKQELLKQGYMFGHQQQYNPYPPSPAPQTGSFETPAPKPHHSRNISTTSVDSTTKDASKKRKRGHPEELDVRRANGDIMMTDAAPPLHSGLTGGLNRLLSRPELPPSPPDVDSPQSPLKRSKQAKHEDKRMKEKEKKRAERATEKEAKKKSKLAKEEKKKKDKKEKSEKMEMKNLNGRWVRTRVRKDSSMQDQLTVETTEEQPAKRVMKAIEYQPNGDSDKLKATPNNAMVLHSKKAVARAEVFLSTTAQDLDNERGCSINRALKKYYKENASRKNAKDEKDLFKTLRFRKNDRGEIVVFIDV